MRLYNHVHRLNRNFLYPLYKKLHITQDAKHIFHISTTPFTLSCPVQPFHIVVIPSHHIQKSFLFLSYLIVSILSTSNLFKFCKHQNPYSKQDKVASLFLSLSTTPQSHSKHIGNITRNVYRCF